MKKNAFVFLLSVVFIITLLPLPAGAYEMDHWTFPEDATLYASDLPEGIALALKQDTTLILDSDIGLCAISGEEHALKVKDNGGHKLTVSNDDGSAVTVKSLVLDGGTYNFTGEGKNTFGIHTRGDINIKNAKVCAKGSYEPIIALYSNIYIKNSSVEATGENDYHANGINANSGGSIFLDGSSVKVSGVDRGIYASGGADDDRGVISIKNSKVESLGSTDGISCADGYIEISDSDVYAKGGRYGLATYRNHPESTKTIKIIIDGGKVTAVGGALSVYSYGDTFITGGEVTFSGKFNDVDLSGYTPANPTVLVAANPEGKDAEKWDGSSSLYGYDYISIVPESYTHTVNVGAANVRDAASSDGARIGSLTEGKEVTVTETDGEWSKIIYGDGYGWIMTKFLTPIEGEESKETENKKVIYEPSVSITEPESGKKPDFNAHSMTNVVEKVEWSRKNKDSWVKMTSDEKFEGGKDYIVEIKLGTEDYNEKFASKEELEITLNSEILLDDEILSAADDTVLIRKEYSLPEDLIEPVQAKENKNPFKDIDEEDYYYDAVIWSYYADPQITKGMDETHFGPDFTVTRGQCVTFLWRAEGCPEPKTKENPFKDVSKSDYYYKAILWANENGITYGTTEDTFSPDDTLTTQHIVTFLYRTQNPGLDGWDGEAASWAGKKYGGKPFGVEIAVNNKTACPRWCVVQFLYELYVPRE